MYGASSQIARDLARLFLERTRVELVRFVRDVIADDLWRKENILPSVPKAQPLTDLGSSGRFDAIINFVGVGDPARAAALGVELMGLTRYHDEVIIKYVQRNSSCRYLFLSSGAAYGDVFDKPVTQSTQARFPINDIHQSHWYGLAKFEAECRHRSLGDMPIVDIRVFSYASRSINICSRFLLADIIQALVRGQILETSSEDIFRDYVSPYDLFTLICLILKADPSNVALDVYSKSPIGKMDLLSRLACEFCLRYTLVASSCGVRATGNKLHYYSKNRRAKSFGYRPRLDSYAAVVDAISYYVEPVKRC